MHYFLWSIDLWQYHVIERPTLEKTLGALTTQRSQKTLLIARIAQNRALRIESALIVVSMLAVR